jgi:hypothetical protein
VAVHLTEQERDRIVTRLRMWDVLEHVLGGELELLERLAVAQVGPEEPVRPVRVPDGQAHHEVDDADVPRHGHGECSSSGSGGGRRRYLRV